MRYILTHPYALWSWLLANGASRATVMLVFITGWYAILTWRMARAIERQTRAAIQPVVLLYFDWKNNEAFYPDSHFVIKNLGTQPLLVLDAKLSCYLFHRKSFTEHYVLWDEHIIPPGETLAPHFDFEIYFEKEKLSWDTGMLRYSLEVVASDLSKQVVLTYQNIPVLHVVNVSRGMPLPVRWRYFLKPFKRSYYRIYYRFKRRGDKTSVTWRVAHPSRASCCCHLARVNSRNSDRHLEVVWRGVELPPSGRQGRAG